jgi:hypothetical protein
MITNVPSADELLNVSLQLYFSTWSKLIQIPLAFEESFTSESGINWDKEREEYLNACQSELQSLCSVVQQSNELALKAKICAVSPFLLLVGSGVKFGAKANDVDYSEFKTLDAVELPYAVNTICSDTLKDEFIKSYQDIRSLRNKITHLGFTNKKFLPKELLAIMAFQHAELWPNRAWLQDRVEFESKTRMAFFHDGSNYSAMTGVMDELPFTMKAFNRSNFKRLFKREKSTRRYMCLHCLEEALADYAGFEPTECKTAFLDRGGKTIACVMCLGEFKVSRERCRNPDCTGNVVADDDDEYAGTCHVCGEASDGNAH